MLDFALRYAGAGLKVMPVNGKIPLTPHGAHDATTDEATIRGWWLKWPTANIGMTLENLVVVDIDPRNGGDPESLPAMPDTCFAKTGGGGWHYLFRAETNVRYNAKPSPGIDVKTGPGAYIVVEPSIHASGERYCWLDESEPWGMTPAIAPAWLGRSSGIAEGGRNDTLTSIAGSMRRRGASVDAITAALLAENKRCVPPLDESEVRTIARSVGRYAPEEEEERVLPETVRPTALLQELRKIYHDGLWRGDLPGWPSVDKLFTVAPGQLTTVTGYPNSGKSQWLDAVVLNLCRQGWRGTFCSLENNPIALHLEKLVKQITGKPVRDGVTDRVSEAEMTQAATTLDGWLRFVLPHEKRLNPSLQDVIDCIELDLKARSLWGNGGKLFAVIDPFNELDHMRPKGESLTDYIGAALSMLRQWARRHGIHVFLVGHPAKQYRSRDNGKLPVVTPDMVADSGHFWNKSDNCITVALTDEHRSAEVDIHVQKIRFSHIGSRGVATLVYDKVSGRYNEKPEEWTSISRVA